MHIANFNSLLCVTLLALASSYSLACRVATDADIGRAQHLQDLVVGRDDQFTKIYLPSGNEKDAKTSAWFHKTHRKVKLFNISPKSDYLYKFVKTDGHSIYYVSQKGEGGGCFIENQPNANMIRGGAWSEMRP